MQKKPGQRPPKNTASAPGKKGEKVMERGGEGGSSGTSTGLGDLRGTTLRRISPKRKKEKSQRPATEKKRLSLAGRERQTSNWAETFHLKDGEWWFGEEKDGKEKKNVWLKRGGEGA